MIREKDLADFSMVQGPPIQYGMCRGYGAGATHLTASGFQYGAGATHLTASGLFFVTTRSKLRML